MQKKKQDIKKLIADIKNAEKYFKRTGIQSKAAYELLEDEITENDTVTQTVYLYIPGTVRDVYEIFMN